MKAVLITGAGRGIGLALAKEFSANGFKVAGTYRDVKSAAELLGLKNVTAVKADVTKAGSLAAVTELLKSWGNVDILVNNAGVIGDKSISLMKMEIEKLHEVFDVNTLGPMRVCRAVIPFMKSGATIAQITSLMGSITDNGSGGYYDYRMSKAALNMFNSCLAKEFPEIKCLVLHPGWVQTDMGGAGATVTAEDCARGLFKIISDGANAKSGHFYDFKGKELPW
jgi:NAD(P)-dependent dehydrogenase (short-subunit alcohol dehydrogenase family)